MAQHEKEREPRQRLKEHHYLRSEEEEVLEHPEKYGTSGGLGPKEEEFLNIDSNQAGLIFLCHVREQKKLEVIYPEFLKES